MGISDLHGQSAGGEARALLISDGISTVRVGKLVVGWPTEGWGAVADQSTRPRSDPNPTSDTSSPRSWPFAGN